MSHTFNLSTQEAESGRSLSSKPAWSTEQVLGQPGLHRQILSGRKKKGKEREQERKKKIQIQQQEILAIEPSLQLQLQAMLDGIEKFDLNE